MKKTEVKLDNTTALAGGGGGDRFCRSGGIQIKARSEFEGGAPNWLDCALTNLKEIMLTATPR